MRQQVKPWKRYRLVDSVETNEKKKSSLLVNILVSCIGTILSLVALEVAFRIITLKKPHRWSDRPRNFFMAANAPNAQDGAHQTYKPEGTFRILVVGDSFTFGPHLQLDDTFPKRMERWLNLNPQAPYVEVINYGFSGYNTVKEAKVIQDSEKLSPDLIVLEITLNDAEPHLLSKEEKENLYGARWLNSLFFRTWSSLGFLFSRLHNSQTHWAYIKYHTQFFENPETFAAFDKALADIAEFSERVKVPVVAMIFPLFDFPFDEKYPLVKTHTIIQEALKQKKIRYLDLTSAYKGIPQERLQVIPGGDNHPNEIAHRIAGERLAGFLKENSLIPGESWPKRRFKQRVNIIERQR